MRFWKKLTDQTHRCQYCHDIELDFRGREPWEVLAPLHQVVGTWSTESLNRLDRTFLPAYPSYRQAWTRPGNKMIQAYRRDMSIGKLVRSWAVTKLQNTIMLPLTSAECDRLASEGCNFCKLLQRRLKDIGFETPGLEDIAFILQLGRFKGDTFSRYGYTLNVGSVPGQLYSTSGTEDFDYNMLFSFHLFRTENST